jgi:lipid A ethanolaminephosphotransferase
MCKDILRNFKQFLKTPASLTRICLILSAYTLIAFNVPFFSEVIDRINGGINGVWIVASMFIIMLALNFCIYYLLLYLGRTVGKAIIAITMIANSLCIYFMINFHMLLDRTMMGNLFNTQYSEAASYLSLGMFISVLALGVVPCIWLFCKTVSYGSAKRFFANFGIALAIILGVLAGNRHNIIWIDYNAPVIGSKIVPWSYIVNTIRHFNHQKMSNRQEIILPDATITTDSRDVFVLVIGESARSRNFSLYGYERQTNPLLAADSVAVLKAEATDTYTTEAVKAVLSHKESNDLYEILPNYLYRNGVDVIWRTSNWGTPPLHVEKEYSKNDLKKRFPEADSKYDGILFHGLKEDISASDSTKIFIGIHTYTSHGPDYYNNVPDEHKSFFPECRTVEMSQASTSELVNAYDNTVLYTDYLVHSVIQMLKEEFPDRRTCVIFISDHGESLGENGNYMHGIPKSMAPADQLDIPFIIWSSDDSLKVKDIQKAGPYNIYHSVMYFLGLESTIYDESQNIFEKCSL